MSHFVVIVFGDDVDGQLEPYSEHIQVEPYFREDGDWVLEWGRKKLVEKGVLDPTLEQIAEAISDEEERYEARDGKLGHMSTYNPKSKWDWYCVGGRWAGYFPMKPGCRGEVGDPCVFSIEPPRQGYADIAKLKDIDLERTMDGTLVPFAFVLNGEWFERGKMGWWACVTGEQDQAQWGALFHKTLREQDPETLLTAVDCHI